MKQFIKVFEQIAAEEWIVKRAKPVFICCQVYQKCAKPVIFVIRPTFAKLSDRNGQNWQ